MTMSSAACFLVAAALCTFAGAAANAALPKAEPGQPTAAAKPRPASGGINCAHPGTRLNTALCANPALLDDAKWLAQVLPERLADPASRQAVARDQRAFERERNKCLPKPLPQPPAAEATEAEPTRLGDAPPGAGLPPPSKDETSPGQDQPAPPSAPAATATDAGDDGDSSPEQVAACLLQSYATWIDTLEAPLRHFADISGDAPGAPTICAAVATLGAQGRLRLLARHAVPLQPVDEADEMHPSAKTDHLRRYMTASAWNDASANAGAWQSILGAVEVSRVGLDPGNARLWALSTLSGDNRDRTVLLFDATPDGSKADRLAFKLGGPGTGPFALTFVRFGGQAFAVETLDASAPAVYALDQSKPVCPGGR